MRKLKVATRGSVLALAQCGQLVDSLRMVNPGIEFEITVFRTTGDKVTDRPLSSFRGTGVFVKELQQALLDGKADLAVHSLKDVPVERPDGLVLAAFPARADVRDVLLTRDGRGLDGLAAGAVVGTGSPRRMVQLRAARSGLRFQDLRGNLDTRIQKMNDGLYDAIVVAAAGMNRLGRAFPPGAVLPCEVCLPAAGQGALVIECRAGNNAAVDASAKVDNKDTRNAVEAERAFLRTVGGGCSMPIAALARVRNAMVELSAVIGDPSRLELVRDNETVCSPDAPRAGEILARRMVETCAAKGILLS